MHEPNCDRLVSAMSISYIQTVFTFGACIKVRALFLQKCENVNTTQSLKTDKLPIKTKKEVTLQQIYTQIKNGFTKLFLCL